MADNSSTRMPRYPFARSNASVEPSARANANDPLAELARLIGQNEPFPEPAPQAAARPESPPPFTDSNADPIPESVRRDLRAILAGHRSDEWPMPPASDDDQTFLAADHEPYPPPPTVDVFPHIDTLRPAPPSYESQTDYGQTEPEAPLYGDDGQLIAHDAYDHDQYPADQYQAEAHVAEEPARRGRKSLFAVVAVFGLAIVGTVGAYAYRTMSAAAGGGTPPLIRADSSPNKVAAAQASDGAGKQIYYRLGSDRAQNEKVVSREEQPVDVRPAQSRAVLPPAPSQAIAPPAPAASGAAISTAGGWPSPAGAGPAPSLGGTTPGSEPKKIRTIPIRSDQLASAPPTESAAAPSAAGAPSASAARPQPQRQASSSPQASSPPSAAGNGPLSLNPQGGAAEPRRARSAAVTPPPSQASESTAAGAYVVQLAAHKSQEEASAAFRSAQSKYPDVLSGRKLLIRRKEVPNKGTFYGAQVGPFASREDAARLCEDLKSAGGTCIVQRN
jgi:cell division septation protein DedD